MKASYAAETASLGTMELIAFKSVAAIARHRVTVTTWLVYVGSAEELDGRVVIALMFQKS